MKNSNTTNGNGWKWITSWVINSNIGISIDFAFLLIQNIFTLPKNQQKCNVSEKNKDFSADGSEYNALVVFLLFTWRHKLKYKPYQIKDNLFLCFPCINNTKMRTVCKNKKVKNCTNFFFLCEWGRPCKSKRKLVLKILNLLIFKT